LVRGGASGKGVDGHRKSGEIVALGELRVMDR